MQWEPLKEWKSHFKRIDAWQKYYKNASTCIPNKIKCVKKAFKPLNIIQKFQIKGKKIKFQRKEVALKLIEKPENRK